MSGRDVSALALVLVLGTSIAGGCGDSGEVARAPLNLERPVDLAFACWGGLRIVGENGTADASDPTTRSAQPLESCRIRSVPVDATASDFVGQRPVGQENLTGEDPLNAVNYFSFIVQSVPGTVAVATFATKPPSRFSDVDVTFVDADPLTPGRNSVVVGALPVAIAADRDGCHMVTANAGSCDLSVLDIGSMVDDDVSTPPQVRTVDVVNATGEPVMARPAAMAAEPAAGTIGVECPADPTGVVYVAYPECHLVAAVQSATGEVLGGVHFDNAGTVTITDGNVSCPAQCGGEGVFGPGERPTTLDLVYDPRVDTRRLVIGADNSSIITVVELDAGYLPLSFSRVPLEGDVGVVDIALTPQIGMGGESGLIEDEISVGGQFQFAYAVVDDGTVRVADVLAVGAECDTQIDPRFLRAETSVARLACMPIGEVGIPRRPLARGPGIELGNGGVPTAVAVVAVPNDVSPESEDPGPNNLIGHFAFVTATTGDTVIINIDDDRFLDVWDPTAPISTQMALLTPHQVRDSVSGRDSLAETTNDNGTPDDASDDFSEPSCGQPNDDTNGGGPRLGEVGVLQGFNRDEISSTYSHVLPSVRQILCTDGDGDESAISELAYAAPVAQRDLAFADLRAMSLRETWNLTWEGALSRDTSGDSVDGPASRPGLVARDGTSMTIKDAARPFCAIGAQPFDIAVLTGCDPTLGDTQCGLGAVCYVHPDATVATGSCLPADQVNALAGTCREFLLSRRRFSIRQSSSGELRVVPRRHALTTSPLDGCVDSAQCDALAAYELSLSSPQPDDPPAPVRTWTCEPDPTRAPGPDRCQMTCTTSADCDDGTSCSNGYCVEGVIPTNACNTGLQRYQIRAGEAYAVLGSETGYLHSVIEDADGVCVIDTAANPLNVGRVPLTAPPCPTPDPTLTDPGPNPCSVTVSHTDAVQDFVRDEEDLCVASGDPHLVARDAPAIRFRNPAFMFHLVDPWYPGDLVCPQDRLGDLGLIPTPHPGQQLEIPLVSGFDQRELPVGAVFPSNVIRGPESSIWVIDEGDNLPDNLSSLSTRGQVFRIETTNLSTVNVVQ